MLTRILVILNSSDEKDEIRVKEKIKNMNDKLSYSPSRISPYSTGVDFYVAGNLSREEFDDVSKKLTDFYIGEYNSYNARSFNAELFDESVEEIQVEYFDD